MKTIHNNSNNTGNIYYKIKMYYTSSEKAKQLHIYTAYTVNVLKQTFLKSLRTKLRFCSCFLTKLNYYGQTITSINTQ